MPSLNVYGQTKEPCPYAICHQSSTQLIKTDIYLSKPNVIVGSFLFLQFKKKSTNIKRQVNPVVGIGVGAGELNVCGWVSGG